MAPNKNNKTTSLSRFETGILVTKKQFNVMRDSIFFILKKVFHIRLLPLSKIHSTHHKKHKFPLFEVCLSSIKKMPEYLTAMNYIRECVRNPQQNHRNLMALSQRFKKGPTQSSSQNIANTTCDDSVICIEEETGESDIEIVSGSPITLNDTATTNSSGSSEETDMKIVDEKPVGKVLNDSTDNDDFINVSTDIGNISSEIDVASSANTVTRKGKDFVHTKTKIRRKRKSLFQTKFNISTDVIEISDNETDETKEEETKEEETSEDQEICKKRRVGDSANILEVIDLMSKKTKRRKRKRIIPRVSSVITHHQSNNNNLFGCKTGYNIHNPLGIKQWVGLRPVFIDACNVALGHTKGRIFSVTGLEICIGYFASRGHTVKSILPQFRLQSGQSTDCRRLQTLEKSGDIICTPSRAIQGMTIASYDDRFIVQAAAEFGGVIVSNDNYRDLLQENINWRETIETRLLMYTWVDDCLIFPMDPLGRRGPTLENFLKF